MKKKIESLKGKKSPCWVKVKFSSTAGIDADDTKECVYGIAYYAKDERAWYVFQNVADGSEPDKEFDSGLKYSWIIGNGTQSAIKRHDISEFYILPRKPRTEEFKRISLKFKAVKFKINSDYSAVVNVGYIKVGCQTISNDVVRNLCKVLID